jgi:biotin transport system substrate-specific component
MQRGVILDPVARTGVANLAVVLAGAIFIGLAAQISIPLPGTPVPITGQTFAVLFVGAAAGLWRGVAATTLYAALGLAGIPWFAGGTSGYVTATFGYILGFVAAAAVVGRLAQLGWTRRPWQTFVAMILGDLVIYLIGVPWLKAALGVSWSTALTLGLAPFLIGDLIKATLAAGLFAVAWSRINSTRD